VSPCGYKGTAKKEKGPEYPSKRVPWSCQEVSARDFLATGRHFAICQGAPWHFLRTPKKLPPGFFPPEATVPVCEVATIRWRTAVWLPLLCVHLSTVTSVTRPRVASVTTDVQVPIWPGNIPLSSHGAGRCILAGRFRASRLAPIGRWGALRWPDTGQHSPPTPRLNPHLAAGARGRESRGRAILAAAPVHSPWPHPHGLKQSILLLPGQEPLLSSGHITMLSSSRGDRAGLVQSHKKQPGAAPPLLSPLSQAPPRCREIRSEALKKSSSPASPGPGSRPAYCFHPQSSRGPDNTTVHAHTRYARAASNGLPGRGP